MILFRADANETIGAGHVMRCLSIADAVRRRGETCLFVMAGDLLAEEIRRHGHLCEILDSDYADTEAELPAFQNILQAKKPKAVAVDSYFVSQRYLSEISQTYDVYYLDDICAFAYPVQHLINYNLCASEADYRTLYQNAPVPEFLLGKEYIPLRAEFQNQTFRKPSAEVRKILVSTGGADTEHILMQILEFLKQNKIWHKYQFHVIVGAANPDSEAIRQAAADMPYVYLHQHVTEMQKLMAACDIAVSAAGSTLYELCSCSMPFVSYIVADNQQTGDAFFAEHGISVSAGDARKQPDFAEHLFAQAAVLCQSYELRETIAFRAWKTADGCGADRIAAHMLAHPPPAFQAGEVSVSAS